MQTLFVFVVMAVILSAGPVRAAAILYELDFVDEPTDGVTIWQYRYSVDLAPEYLSVVPGAGFSVEFEGSLYADVEVIPSELNYGWDILTLQPDAAIPAPGLYDALALYEDISIGTEYVVQFRWLGAYAPPGDQRFTVYFLDPDSGSLTELTSGTTVSASAPVDEPATPLLAAVSLAMSLAGLCGRRRPA